MPPIVEPITMAVIFAELNPGTKIFVLFFSENELFYFFILFILNLLLPQYELKESDKTWKFVTFSNKSSIKSDISAQSVLLQNLLYWNDFSI